MHLRQMCCVVGHTSSNPTHAYLSIRIVYIADHTLYLACQAEHQATVRAVLQQVGVTLSLMAEEQQTFLAAAKESTEEQGDLSKYNKIPIETMEEYAHLPTRQGLDDP